MTVTSGPRIHHAAGDAAEETLQRTLRAHLAAIDASRDACRRLAAAGPGERQDAWRGLQEALRRQSDAERAFERARQQARPPPYGGRPRMSRY